MRVAYVIPALVTGGAETMVTHLINRISEGDCVIDVICISKPSKTHLSQLIEQKGIAIHYSRSLTKIGTFLNVYNELSRFSPDIIHSHISGTMYSIPWALIKKCHIIHTIHTRPDKEFSKKLSHVIRKLVKKDVITLVAVSKKNMLLARNFYCADGDKVVYINNPVDTDKYFHIDRKDDKVVFINVGRQDKNKNQILAVKAMKNVLAKCPYSELLLVGDGDQHEYIKTEVEKLELTDKIKLVGELFPVNRILSGADVYVSTSHVEGLPLSMLEAMASSLPIISTNVGGIPDIIKENGILIDDNDENTLETSMISLAIDREKREYMGKLSKKYVEKFDISECAERYYKLYLEHIV